MRLVEALEDANKDFELMIYPSSRHGIGGPHYTRLQLDFIRRTLGGTKPEKPSSPGDLAEGAEGRVGRPGDAGPRGAVREGDERDLFPRAEQSLPRDRSGGTIRIRPSLLVSVSQSLN